LHLHPISPTIARRRDDVMQAQPSLRIGGASGFWGESDMAVPQLLASHRRDAPIDFIVFDYLAEITMSILARARAADPAMGYASDFVSAVIAPHARALADAGIRLISNAGGVNPLACAAAIRAELAQQGVARKVVAVTGDDLLSRAAEFVGAREMFSGARFPEPAGIASINAYLGGFAIARALDDGADIVITGRCVDSAVTLGACIHHFGWHADDLDRLAGGSLAGHILECGPQATGGNFTDWADVAEGVAGSLANIGYPIAEIAADGSAVITKAQESGGQVTVGTVGEQMLYEIGDPQAYALPDVVCDFSGVTIDQIGPDRVAIAGARGAPAPDTYKLCVTYADGFRLTAPFFFTGGNAAMAARCFAEAALTRARGKLHRMNAPDFTEVLVSVHGDGSAFGRPDPHAREVSLIIGVKHADARACQLLLKEATGMGLASPPGLSLFAGGRPKPSPLVRLFSALIPKDAVSILIDDGMTAQRFHAAPGERFDPAAIVRPAPPPLPKRPSPEDSAEPMCEVPLHRLAFGRSGDKGDNANIGLLPRHPALTPWLWAALDSERVRDLFAHLLARPEDPASVERWYLPGTGAINFLLHDVLGGGGIASLRGDPQGKAFAQILLAQTISIPASLERDLP
jgi:hypothetical protein